MTAAPVCSGAFFRLHCRHEQLFDSEYKRSNRNRGRKIIRCFPHCCPSHVERSYCGSSLEVAVDIHQPLVVNATTLFVFARFETVDQEDSPVVGDRCSLHHLQLMSKNDTNPDAQWTQATFQSSPVASNSSTVFELNGQTSSKWYYDWESGANKARRLTKHVLKAYILYRHPEGAQDDLVDVIGIVSSPAFTLVSYRRSWESDGQAVLGGQSAAIQVNGLNEANNLHRIVRGQISEAFSNYQNNATEPTSKGVAVSKSDLQRPSPSYHQKQVSPREQEFVQRDPHVWGYQPTAQLRLVKDLSVIYYLVSHTPMSVALKSTRVREHIRGALLDYGSFSTTDEAELLQPGDLLSILFDHSNSHRMTVSSTPNLLSRLEASKSGPKPLNVQVERLLVIMARLAIWLLSVENIRLIRSFFISCTNLLLQKESLREAYVRFIDFVRQRVEVFWSHEVTASERTSLETQVSSASDALHSLSENVLALSHVDTEFQWMWPDLRHILEAPASPLWESFTAQVRETFVRKQLHRHQLPIDEDPRGLNGDWCLETVATDGRMHDMSISEALLGIFQLQSVSIRVVDGVTLKVRSAASLLPQENAWMALVCDTTPRTASVMPIGLSTLVGFQVSGVDYIGTMDSKQSRVQLELYWWPARTVGMKRARATQVVLTLKLSSSQSTILLAMKMHHADLNAVELKGLASVELGSAKDRIRLHAQWVPVWEATAQYVSAAM